MVEAHNLADPLPERLNYFLKFILDLPEYFLGVYEASKAGVRKGCGHVGTFGKWVSCLHVNISIMLSIKNRAFRFAIA